ncbi:conjugal transfer protein [Streptomyces sp. NBC_01221]|uniref:conjugal transfer protein n=1 Tax=Streptomyces sp. NBC_01221 TaxID=2903782 RepID=UPI00224CB92D|nr:conjugal transfer protein [Streptomyces sp. NBC_01221]MCX4792583.1 conjugal transfer protein [Streptomyces sp. NBC_01221]
MKRARRQRKAGKQKQFVEEVWDEEGEQPQETPAAEPDETGWTTSTAHLSGITRLVRLGAWALVASGPVFGVLALLGSSGSAQGVTKPVAAPAPASQTGPAGFAELFVAAYLQAGQGSERDLAPYYSGSVVLSVKPGTRTATQSTVIASREVQPGYWSITVAADVSAQDDKGKAKRLGVQYFRVGIQATGPAGAGGTATSAAAATGYAAMSLPAQVAAPSALKPGALAYESDRGSSSTDPAVETARGFLTAYLAGTSELDRYTSPGASVQAISPAPYAAVKVTGVKDDAASSGQQKVPADGTVLHQLVQVDATDRAGSPVSLSYALTLKSRAGRWEVSSVDDAPAIRASSTPFAAPHITPTPDATTAAPSPSPSSS